MRSDTLSMWEVVDSLGEKDERFLEQTLLLVLHSSTV